MKNIIKAKNVTNPFTDLFSSGDIVTKNTLKKIVLYISEETLKDISKRLISPSEIKRMRKTYKYFLIRYKKIEKNKQNKKALLIKINKEKYRELFEGALLKAKESYEEKKLPLIGYLIANSLFTNTPITNNIQSLIYAEQLSYRQLCIIAVIGQNEWQGFHKLTDKPLYKQDRKNLFDEEIEGIYSDLNHLLALGIIGQELSPGAGPTIPSGMFFIAPALLKLQYAGRLLHNGMMLDSINKKDIIKIVQLLRK